jgi:hypothetical protein
LSAFLGWWVLGVWVFFGGVWCVFWFFDIFGLLWLRAFGFVLVRFGWGLLCVVLSVFVVLIRLLIL